MRCARAGIGSATRRICLSILHWRCLLQRRRCPRPIRGGLLSILHWRCPIHRRGVGQIYRDDKLSILHWRCRVYNVNIGALVALIAFNTPLEMPRWGRRPTPQSWRTFNTPLEMPGNGNRAPHDVRNAPLSILHWRCPLVTKFFDCRRTKAFNTPLEMRPSCLQYASRYVG